MKPGGVILIADGAISIEVVRILSATELLGRVVNSHKLGQRKNCNLPGALSNASPHIVAGAQHVRRGNR
jgi:pyruvate kinase